MDQMNIEVLVFEGCPNAEPTLRLVRKLVADLGILAEVLAVNIADEKAAVARQFLGSPSVQIDGVDIEDDRKQDPPCYGCRIYRTSNGNQGIPPEKLLLQALLSRVSPALGQAAH